MFLVEDSQAARSLMQEAADSIGVQVIGSASTEAEANYWLAENLGQWDLAVIDLVLEQGSGLGVVGKTSSLPNRGKLVVFSGFASSGVREHCIRLGADMVFDKAHTAAFLEWLHQAAGPSPDT